MYVLLSSVDSNQEIDLSQELVMKGIEMSSVDNTSHTSMHLGQKGQ